MKEDIQLIAHLMRRAGFGTSHDQLKEYTSKGYQATVNELLESSHSQSLPEDLIRRYHYDLSAVFDSYSAGSYWLYHLITTDDPLREKITLFWHNIFATGYAKVTVGKVMTDQIKMFRRFGLGNYKTLLLELSKDPAMLIWLDNVDNHDGAINENFGRELLELFSMGVGNYSEDDIKECSRAFTGWSVANTEYTKQLAVRNSIWPYGKIAWRFEYKDEDHDEKEKTFLGETGNFNGEDIIDIICRQEATAKFIARHMYHFFVADEPPVPQWPYEPPQDPHAIDILVKSYFESGYEIKSMLRTLFHSDFFRSSNCRYAKIKSPAELVTGVIRLTKEFECPNNSITERNYQMGYMGQELVNPPSVEGWHQGLDWIETGSLMERLNFAAEQLSNLNKPGVKSIVQRILANQNASIPPEMLLDKCLEQLGSFEIKPETRKTLIEYVKESYKPNGESSGSKEYEERRVSDVLRMVASIPEFQRS